MVWYLAHFALTLFLLPKLNPFFAIVADNGPFGTSLPSKTSAGEARAGIVLVLFTPACGSLAVFGLGWIYDDAEGMKLLGLEPSCVCGPKRPSWKLDSLGIRARLDVE